MGDRRHGTPYLAAIAGIAGAVRVWGCSGGQRRGWRQDREPAEPDVAADPGPSPRI